MGHNYQIKGYRWSLTTSADSYIPAWRFDPPTHWDTSVNNHESILDNLAPLSTSSVRRLNTQVVNDQYMVQPTLC